LNIDLNTLLASKRPGALDGGLAGHYRVAAEQLQEELGFVFAGAPARHVSIGSARLETHSTIATASDADDLERR
jgi:hypothetical protein